MAGMSNGYVDAIANHGAGLISHIGLVDGDGIELSGTPYVRKAVFWTTATGGNGTVRPYANVGLNEDLVFGIPGDTTVGGWRGYNQASPGTGSVNYGGKDLDNETFTNQGEYRLLGGQSGIIHSVPD